MSRLSIALIAVTLAATAAPAFAQQTPPRPSPAPSPNTAPPVGIRRMDQYSAPALRAEYETFLDAASGNNLPPQSLARIDLANRISTLIELGRCDEARGLANEAGELQMALRARQMCRADRDL